MKRLLAMAVAAVAMVACGDVTGDGDDERLSWTGESGGDSSEHALQSLEPQLRLVGLGDISESFDVERIRFDAELFLLPEDLANVGDAIPIRFLLDEDGEHTDLPERALRVRPGAYQVLVRVRPSEDGVSLSVAGEYAAPEDEEELVERSKAEPAPSPSEPAPSPSEPAPSPSDEASNTELPSAERDDETDDGDSRQKPDEEGLETGDTRAEGDALFVRSTRSFEFYAGTVDIIEGDTDMVVTWDVRDWLRDVLAEPLGLTLIAPLVDTPQSGFGEAPADFRIDAH
jgi:hypothetical protein